MKDATDAWDDESTVSADNTATAVESTKGKSGGKPRAVRQKISAKDKFIKSVLASAGIEELPSITSLFRSRHGTRTEISDIAVFIDEVDCPVLGELSKKWKKKNTVHSSSAEVELANVKKVAIEILRSGRIYTPIQVVKLTNRNGSLQCISGRHRLAFIALFYGMDIKVRVIDEEMSSVEASDATIYANESRKPRVFEKTEHIMYRQVGGDRDIKREVLYEKSFIKKSMTSHFSMLSVFQHKVPGTKLMFNVSLTSSRKDGDITGQSISGYWQMSIRWFKGMKLEEFDKVLKASCSFLNAYVTEVSNTVGFDARQHLASMPLRALGGYFESIYGNVENPDELAERAAQAMVSIEDVARQKKDKTLLQLKEFINK